MLAIVRDANYRILRSSLASNGNSQLRCVIVRRASLGKMTGVESKCRKGGVRCCDEH
jgi:hypothetical protein